jgi:hypothetical protein
MMRTSTTWRWLALSYHGTVVTAMGYQAPVDDQQ